MAYMARWGNKGFIVSPSKIAVLEGLSTSLTLKEDSENDTSGTQPTNTRGRELRPITFKVKYLRAAGVDPRAQIAEWEAELGNAYPLIIGNERFGETKMKLTKVASSDILLSNSGAFLQAVVSITLEEYSEGKTSKLLGTTTTASGNIVNSEAAAKAAETYKATIEAKKAALAATPTATDKAQKSPVAKFARTEAVLK